MKKYILALSLVSSLCFADIALNTKLTLISAGSHIENNAVLTAELGERAEVIVGDFKIAYVIKSAGEGYLGEFEIYYFDELISDSALVFTQDVPASITLTEGKGDGSGKEFSFSISVVR